MADPLESVNEIVRVFARLEEAKLKEGDTEAARLHRERHMALTALIEELQERRRAMLPVPASYGDISDLPDELLAQLSGVKTDELEDQIFSIVKAASPSIELDRLLIELFRRFGEVYERRFINNKCYRMAQKELIFAVPGRKGVYTATKPKEPDPLKEMFGEPDAEPAPRTDFSVNLDDEIPF